MYLQLEKLRTLNKKEADPDIIKIDEKTEEFDVLFCGICRTDAKMWDEGHRDLIFPRILGHEFVVADQTGQRYAVWPGESCETCEYCKSGRENICEDIKILGFHKQGGYADKIYLSRKNIFPLEGVPDHIICFAEPLACSINALEKLRIRRGDRVIIFGAGTQGLITALLVKDAGGQPLLIEKNAFKISKGKEFCGKLDIPIVKETDAADFEVAINACSSSIAFSLCLTKLKKGGRFSFFSGLPKNDNLENSLVNLIHYKEYEMSGSYGQARLHIQKAIPLLVKYQSILKMLVEDIIQPDEACKFMSKVLSGDVYRFIIDFRKVKNTSEKQSEHKNAQKQANTNNASLRKHLDTTSLIEHTVKSIVPVETDFLPMAQHHIDNKTKPVGSLGRLEDIAVRIALIQKTLAPHIKKKGAFVFAADHGVAIEGVSTYPSKVTGQMVNNFLNQGAAINVICKKEKIDLNIVDMGVNKDFFNESSLIQKKIRGGTRNFAVEEAMTRAEALKAIENGIDAFNKVYYLKKYQIVAIGEMGIGNTTSATAIACTITGKPVSDMTGKGTGLDVKGRKRKIDVIEKAINFHKPISDNPVDILQKVGGFEIAGMAGAMIAAAQHKVVIVLDGFISSSAALIANLFSSDITSHCIAGHQSVEPGHIAILDHLKLKPVLELDMRLGEGTGAAITMSIAETAICLYKEMATFEEAGISRKN